MTTADPPAVYNGRYELVRLIARGGMAEVYLARDLLLDRPVALKVLFPELSVDRTFVARFRREAQAAANLSHPNIVPIYDWGEAERTYFIVMEYIAGSTLSALLRAGGPLLADRAAGIGAEVAGALAYAHRQGVIHRDVKPGNVLISDDGTVKVADFGIARAKADESLTQTGAVMGTATYFSPEQAQGEVVDARSDVYSLGVVLYEAVSGAPPFSGDNPLAIAYKHVREEPARLTGLDPEVPPAFESIVLHALTKDPAQRYQSADELRADLLRFQHGRAVTAPELGALGAGAIAAGAYGADATAIDAQVGTGGGGASTPATTVLAPAALAGATLVNPRVGGPVPGGSGGGYDSEQMIERAGRTGIWALALLVLLIVLGVVIYLILRSAGLFSSQAKVEVPAGLAGEPAPRAESALTKVGLHYNVVNVSRGSTPGDVVSTNPSYPTRVAKGATVTLDVTQPDVASYVGQKYSVANAALTKLGYSVSENPVQSSKAAGTIISQNHTGPTPKTTPIVFTVSSGPATVQVPDLHGDNQVQAGVALQQSNLQAGNVTMQHSTSVPSGEVIRTSPPANSPVAPQTSVALIVSSGPPVTTTLPDVTGMQASLAQSSLTGDGFTVAPLVNPTSCDPTQPTCVVLSQSPAGNTTQVQGTAVSLTVGVAPTTTTTAPTTTTTTFPTTTTTFSTTTTLPPAGGGGTGAGASGATGAGA